MKLTDLSLTELYGKPKKTKAVEEAIVLKDNFKTINKTYCDNICQLKCKSYNRVQLYHNEVDVLILQDHQALPDKYKTGQDVENIYQGIIKKLAEDNLQGLSYRVLNLLKCQIQDDDIIKGKPPLLTKLKKCQPYLQEEIRSSKAKVIISLTTNTTKALGMIKFSNSGNRGEIHNNIVITLHPKVTTMIRQNSTGKDWGPDYYEVIDRDFNKAGRLARGELVIPTLEQAMENYKKDIVICRTISQVEEEANRILDLPEDTIISWDTETTGLDPHADLAKLLTVQFGYRDHSTGRIRAVVFPLWHRANLGYNPEMAWDFIVPILESTQLKKVGHNVKFDILYTYFTTGLRVKGIAFDTMLVLHDINSGIGGAYGLKRALWDWLIETGLGGYEDKLKLSNLQGSTIDSELDIEEDTSEALETN